MISRTIEVKPTPEELADEFIRMGSDDQATFLDCIGSQTQFYWPMQLQYVSQSVELTESARQFVALLAQYLAEPTSRGEP